MTDDITEEDLRNAVIEALVKPRSGFAPGETTAPATARKHGISPGRARRIFTSLTEKGVVEPKKLVYIDPWGDKQSVKGYRLINKEIIK